MIDPAANVPQHTLIDFPRAAQRIRDEASKGDLAAIRAVMALSTMPHFLGTKCGNKTVNLWSLD
jgi:hypothetical protein